MIDHIKFSGREHPVLFGHLAIYNYEKESGIGLHEVDVASMTFFYTMLYHGLRQGYKKEGKECPYKSVEDLCEDLPVQLGDLRTQMLKIFTNQTRIGKEEGEEKPKAKG